MQSRIFELSSTGAELPAAVRRVSELKLTGWFYVGTQGWTASLFVEAGRVVSAKFGSADGLDALAQLARVLPGGEFVFEPDRPAPATRTLDIGPDELVARLQDPDGHTEVDLPARFLDSAPRRIVPEGAEYAFNTASINRDDTTDSVLFEESPARPGGPGWLRIGLLTTVVVMALAAGLLVLLRKSTAPGPEPPIATLAAAVEPSPALPPAVPTVAPTPELSAVRAFARPRVILNETFADNSANWPTDPHGVAWIQSGAYHLGPRQPGQFVAIGAPVAAVFGDVTVSATFQKVDGPAGGGYGIIFRDQGPGPRDGINQTGRYYVVEVGDKGVVGMWRRDGDQWTDILPWTNSDAVRTGTASNQVAVRASGDKFTIIVNGHDVATRTDGVLAFGAVGIFVGGDGNQVRVQDLTILAPSRT